MTGFSSPIPKPDAAAPGRNAPHAETPHVGAAQPLKEGNPVHTEERPKREAFDASAYRANPLPPNPAYEEFQREYAARYAAYSEPMASRRRRGFRAIHMALIFTLGAAAGLGGAWWADSADRHSAQSSPVPGIVAAKPDLPPYEELLRRKNTQAPQEVQGASGATAASEPQGVRGIRSSELPYDGRPPEAMEESLASAAPALTPAPLSSAAVSSGGSDTEESVAPAPTPARGASSSAAAPEASRKPAVSPDAASASRAKQADDKASAAAASSKRTTVAKNAKSQEIERIRRQADEELKKKNGTARRGDDERNTSQAAQKKESGNPPASTLASATNYKALLAQCEAASNIFRREQCKWKLCNGMWGKNGCPSYAKPNSVYNY
ncbi:hypothetical protein [Noviherbaspirillum malthae]|uniref:hypothetical protein n=1 Tax=Noviherbaspirillum malthae TaxID=1260987 RepID=UPI00188F7418|nr:hypothetical protein [Noviherbaspirillum malthae]